MKLNAIIDKNDYCIVCFKKIRRMSISFFLNNDLDMCLNCFRKMNPKLKRISLNNIRGIALFPYDGYVKNLLFQYKGCKDIALKNVFFEFYAFVFKIIYRNYFIVPVPSTKQSDKNRGFNHVEQMCKILNLPLIKCLKKKGDFKQSSLNYIQRLVNKDNFYFDGDKSSIYNKKILIVDDVITSSTTMRACIKLIEECHPKKISFLVMAYSCRKMS